MRILYSKVVFVLALLVYTTLALKGIHYGLPHENHLLTYNSDETTWIEALSRIRPQEHRFNPHPEFGHPTFYLGVYGLMLGVLSKTGWITLGQSKEWFRDHPEEFAKIFLAGRYLQVIFGFLLMFAVWITATHHFGRPAANLSAMLLAITPSLIGASHFSQANIPVAFLAFVAFACLFTYECDHQNNLFMLRVGAFVAGLAVSTKYSAIPFVLPFAYWGLRIFRVQFTEALLVAFLVIAGFVAGSPFALLAPSSFWTAFHRFSGVALEPLHASLFEKLGFPFLYPLRHAMGAPLEIVSLAAVGWFTRRERFSPALLVTLLGFLGGTLAAGSVASSARVFVIVPVLLLVAGKLLSDIWMQSRAGGSLITLGLLFCTLLPSTAIALLHSREPLQKEVSQWMVENIPRRSSIGINRDIFWWTPPVVYTSAQHPERLKDPYQVKLISFSVAGTVTARPDYILLSGAERTNEALRAPGGREFLAWLDRGDTYQRVRFFPRQLRVGPWTWNRPEYPLYTDDDLWYPSQELFQRKHASR